MKSKKVRKPWVTAECLEMIRKKNFMYAQFIKLRKPEDFKCFKKYRNLVTKALRNAKRDYFTNLLNEVTVRHPDKTWRSLNTLLNRSRTCNEITQIEHNGAVLSGVHLADEFNSYFTNLVKSNHDESIRQFLTTPNENSVFLSPTTQQEIFAVFISLSNSRSRDVDGICIRPIKYVLDCILPALEHIYNLCLHSGVFPDKMKRAKVVVIYKSGDKNNFSNYRPISILPAFSKALEKIISIRINSFCDKNNILSTQQFGFRKGRSTELALLTQKDIILQSFEDKKLTMGIFVDFSKAFDSLNHHSLLLKLEHYGFRGVALALFRSYLDNREQCVLINECMSKFMKLTAGVPQGSTLGPLLFNLYVNDVVNITTEATFIIYADDTSIFIQSKDPHELFQIANATLDNLNIWSAANSLKINTTKTKAVVFTPSQKRLYYQFRVRIGLNNIEVVSEIKTLGVIFNQNMSWTSHVNRVLSSLAKISGALCRVRYVLPEKFNSGAGHSVYFSKGTLKHFF